jgi:hypothetical protein
MYYRLFFAAFTVFCCLRCSDRQTEQLVEDPTQPYAYFPLQIGKYIDYTVDSIVFDYANGGSLQISSRTYVREKVADTLRDNSGTLVFSLERYEKVQLGDPWQIKQINTASRNSTQAIGTEDNLRFLKMVFPLDRHTSWDGNYWIDANREIEVAGERMRPFSNWSYRVDSMDIAQNIGTFAFDSVLVIIEANSSTVFERRLSRVHYAKHIGMVQREQWILDSQYCNRNPVPSDCATKPWQDKAERGYILKQTVLGFN